MYDAFLDSSIWNHERYVHAINQFFLLLVFTYCNVARSNLVHFDRCKLDRSQTDPRPCAGTECMECPHFIKNSIWRVNPFNSVLNKELERSKCKIYINNAESEYIELSSLTPVTAYTRMG